ncbi:putative metallopeptidase [Acidianus manzaensis]|uniref:Metallopeptidase n=1 Tax=Acidianus manzaensis TaxID=282676 RepID=A0A1W6K106_9CREN|nr:putative metallopeptidase [Acidianus manzaensis]ARM76160.1 metallopeptidase [Acidianus manzaensis]
MIELEKASDVMELAREINSRINMNLNLDKIAFLRSKNAKTTAIARTLVLPAQWRYVLGEEKIYIVEVISEKYDKLTCEQKVYVVTHELMHIPYTMKGLRNHNYKGFKQIRRISNEVSKFIC